MQERQDLVGFEEQPVHTGETITRDELAADKVPERAGAQTKQRCGLNLPTPKGGGFQTALCVMRHKAPRRSFRAQHLACYEPRLYRGREESHTLYNATALPTILPIL